MRCLDVKVELQAYVDRELSPERAVLLEQHLVGCEGCQAELTRLQAVVTALETWPLEVEPTDLAAHVMARVRSRPTVPPFRLRWSDFAISLAGAGLVFAVMLTWRCLAPAIMTHLHHTHTIPRLEMLRLEALLMVRRLITTSAVTWQLLLGGTVLTTVLAIALWGLDVWSRETLPV